MGRVKNFFTGLKDLDRLDDEAFDAADADEPAVSGALEAAKPAVPNEPHPFSEPRSENHSLSVYSLCEYKECAEIADLLKKKEPVIVNFRNAKEPDAVYVFNFLCGAVCVLGGGIQKISSDIFLFTPGNISIEIPKAKPEFDIPLSHDWTIPLDRSKK